MNSAAIGGIVAIIILAAIVGNLDLITKYFNSNFVTLGFKGIRGE